MGLCKGGPVRQTDRQTARLRRRLEDPHLPLEGTWEAIVLDGLPRLLSKRPSISGRSGDQKGKRKSGNEAVCMVSWAFP